MLRKAEGRKGRRQRAEGRGQKVEGKKGRRQKAEGRKGGGGRFFGG
ncbi:hypothetical protein [[Phormidium ambiguum] IAM M-71]|nr:hypothetical protein [Phormidium ambiguum]